MGNFNFSFLSDEWEDLALLGSLAESSIYDDPNNCLVKLRVLCEKMINIIIDQLSVSIYGDFHHKINQLHKMEYIDSIRADAFHSTRKIGNKAAHPDYFADEKDAELTFKTTFELAAWFAQKYGSEKSTIPVFKSPKKETKIDLKELDAIRQRYEHHYYHLESQLKKELQENIQATFTNEKIKAIIQQEVLAQSKSERPSHSHPVQQSVRNHEPSKEDKTYLTDISNDKDQPYQKIKWGRIYFASLFLLVVIFIGINIFTLSGKAQFFPAQLDTLYYQQFDGEVFGSSLKERAYKQAIDNDDINKVAFLNKFGADPNLVNKEGDSGLLLAARKNNLKAAIQLLTSGANPNLCNKKQECPITEASRVDNYLLVNALLDHNVNPNIKDGGKSTAFYYAILNKNKKIAKLLIENDFDINQLISETETPLSYAIKEKDKDLTTLLLHSGADVNVPNGKNQSPFLLALQNGDTDFSELLIKGRVLDKTLFDQAMEETVKRNSDYLASLLLHANPQHNPSQDLLLLAIQKNNRKLVELFISEMEELDFVGTNGTTPLTEAVKSTNIELVRQLLELGANPNFPTRDGKIPIQFSLTDQLEISDLLEANGSKKTVEFMMDNMNGYWISKDKTHAGQFIYSKSNGLSFVYMNAIKPESEVDLNSKNGYSGLRFLESDQILLQNIQFIKVEKGVYNDAKEDLEKQHEQNQRQKEIADEDRQNLEAYEKAKEKEEILANQYNKQKEALRNLAGYWKRSDNKENKYPYW